MKTYVHLWYLTEFFLQWEMFQKKFVEKITTHVLCSISFSRNLCHLWNNVEKYWVGQATDGNIIWRICFVCCITEARVQTCTLIIFNTYCFCMVTVVMLMHLNVTLYKHCLSSCLLGCCQYKFKICAKVRQLVDSLLHNPVNLLCVCV